MSYEIFIGKISNRNDPEKRGRVKVTFDEAPLKGEWPEWVDPSFPFAGKNCGWFFVPPADTAIECELYRGKGPDVSIDTPRIRWRAALYNRVDQIPEEFKKNYPKVSGFKTPGNHILILDDTEGKEFITLGHGKKARTFLCFDRYGSVSLRCHRALGGSIGIDMDARKGAIQIIAASSIDIRAEGSINLNAAAVTVNGRPVMTNSEPV